MTTATAAQVRGIDMTNIWDVLQHEWNCLSKKQDANRAKCLSRALKTILDFVKMDRKYDSVMVWKVRGNSPLISSLEGSIRIISTASSPVSYEDESLVTWTIQALHDFDHAHDGHYTEMLIYKAARGRGEMKKVANELLDYIHGLNYQKPEAS